MIFITYLKHHGILGQKWGIRRYQNYDGTYTQAGVEHYKKFKKDYDAANDRYISLKKSRANNNVTKEELEKARLEKKEAKRKMNAAYNQVEQDYKADKGKELYNKGRTITNANGRIAAAGTITAGASAAAVYLQKNEKITTKEAAAIIGASSLAMAATAVASGISEIGNNKLRAYYSHSRPKSVQHGLMRGDIYDLSRTPRYPRSKMGR